MVSGLSDTSSPFNASTQGDAENISVWPGGRDAKKRFRRDLVLWFKTHGRDLPWRRTTDAYAILVSEFMLQQTQVATVISYYDRWMTKFPNLAALAAASEQEVLSVWQGLGYYSRARNLHRAAKAVMTDHAGRIPRSLESLRSLPGVGDYTAAAVAAFAWDDPVPVVDANIARVLARLTDWRDRIDTADGRQFLRDTAIAIQDGAKCGRLFNSALMELGALVCRSGQPDCLRCPVKRHCTTSVPAALPVKAPRATTEFRIERVAFILEGNQIFLTQADGAKWRGLWHMPGANPRRARVAHSLEYPITKYRVRLDVIVSERPPSDHLRAFEVSDLDSVPIPAPHRRAISAMLEIPDLLADRQSCDPGAHGAH